MVDTMGSQQLFASPPRPEELIEQIEALLGRRHGEDWQCRAASPGAAVKTPATMATETHHQSPTKSSQAQRAASALARRAPAPPSAPASPACRLNEASMLQPPSPRSTPSPSPRSDTAPPPSARFESGRPPLRFVPSPDGPSAQTGTAMASTPHHGLDSQSASPPEGLADSGGRGVAQPGPPPPLPPPYPSSGYGACVARRSVAFGAALNRCYVNKPSSIRIQARDAVGENCLAGGEIFVVRLRGPVEVRATVTDDEDGSYTARFVAPITGTYAAHITMRHAHICGSPIPLRVSSGVLVETKTTLRYLPPGTELSPIEEDTADEPSLDVASPGGYRWRRSFCSRSARLYHMTAGALFLP